MIILLPDSERKLQPTWATSKTECLTGAWDIQMLPWDAWDTGGMLTHGESPCNCWGADIEVIMFLLEIGSVSVLCGEKNRDIFVQLPAVLPENGREKA